MRYFTSLPHELQVRAWKVLSEDLIESWLFNWDNEQGDFLSSSAEEQLLTFISNDTTDYVMEAKAFYNFNDAYEQGSSQFARSTRKDTV